MMKTNFGEMGQELWNWMTTSEARQVSLAHRHHYLHEYLALRAKGAAEAALVHPRGNAQGRFYEDLVLHAVSAFLAHRSEPGATFVCAGGDRTDLGVLHRSKAGDVVVEAPSWIGGPKIGRAEFDGLYVSGESEVVLFEITASKKNLPDLVLDLWRKQLVSMRLFGLSVPPPVLMFTPQNLPSVAAKVTGFREVVVPFPEALWELTTESDRPGGGPPVPLQERVGLTLHQAAPVDFARLVGDLASEALALPLEEEQVLGFCSFRRDEMAIAKRIYLGAISGDAEEIANMVGEKALKKGEIAPLLGLLRDSKATVHVSLRTGEYGKAIACVMHILTKKRPSAKAEYRLDFSGRGRWIKDYWKSVMLFNEIPRVARELTLDEVRRVAEASRMTRQLEPTIAISNWRQPRERG